MAEKNFEELLAEVQRTKKSIITYPRLALNQVGASRRGWKVVEAVNSLLDKYDVACDPDFGSAWIYGQIELKPKPKVPSGTSINTSEDWDPTPRLSLLKAANLNKVKEAGSGEGLISVNRQTPLDEAITLMLLHDFSQLPILSGSRDVEGIVSWRSIGRAKSLQKECRTVSDCKDDVVILGYDEPLFDAVKVVLKNEVVLVKQKDKTISGIVTITDIGEQFISMAEPFLLIEQIENHVRRLLDQKFDPEDLIFSNSPEAKPKEIKNISDLTFGQYIKIIEDPKKFEKIKIAIDRKLLAERLDNVRVIRNDVMHFDPDGITQSDLELLRQTASFLHNISSTLKK